MKKHNFYAGPSILPDEAIEATAQALKDFEGTGISLASISHRSKQFDAVIKEAQALMKELLGIPEGYHVLFLGGGASTQFAMVPYNLMISKAAYLNTGSWAKKAIKEARLFGEVIEYKNEDFYSIPKGWEEEVPSDADYVHITTNNTIYGTEIHRDFEFDMPVVADMSSDILSRPVDVSKYGIIYGGAQKNLAPAGVTFVIIKEDLLGKVERDIPTMLNYNTHIEKESLFNTPPVVPIFTLMHTLRWVKAQGGVAAMQKSADEKSEMLYNEIDRNKLFKGTVAKEDRSKMNICFVMEEKYQHLEKSFMEYATSLGMVGIKGHRSVGGFRASNYNALPKESIEAMVKAMQDFEKEQA
jgi:phosphoserine aminotransferase